MNNQAMYHRDPKTNREVYEFNPFENRYVYKSLNNVEVFALDENNNPYYATKDKGQEYYPKVFGDEEYTNRIHYIKNKSRDREIYPIKKIKDTWRQLYDSKLQYAIDNNNNQYYAQTEYKNEYPFKNIYAKDRNNVEKYPLDRDFKGSYVKDSKRNDVLAKSTFGEYYATTDITRKETIYPKKSNGEEFYAKWAGKEYYGTKKQYPLKLNSDMNVIESSLNPP